MVLIEGFTIHNFIFVRKYCFGSQLHFVCVHEFSGPQNSRVLNNKSEICLLFKHDIKVFTINGNINIGNANRQACKIVAKKSK